MQPRPTSSRTSLHPSLSRPANQPSLTSLLPAKALELQGLQEVKAATADLLARVEALGDKADLMSDGGEAVGDVLRNWAEVFRVIAVVGKKQAQEEAEGRETGEDTVCVGAGETGEGEREVEKLVRVPLDDDVEL